MRFLWAALPALLILAGCASTSSVDRTYNPTTNQTTYRSSKVTVVSAMTAGGLGSSASIDLEARSTCKGEECTPKQVALIFSIDSRGNASRIGMKDRSVRLEADGVEFQWKDITSRTEDDQFATVTNVINVVKVDVEQLERIAKATVVSGSVGNHSFRLSPKERRPLARYVTLVKNGGTMPGDEAPSSPTE